MSTACLREIIRFVRPPGLANFVVVFRAGNRGHQGLFWPNPHYTRFRVDITIDPEMPYPMVFSTPAGRGYLGVTVYSQEEAVVALFAHELRHRWQHRVPRGRRVWGARGQYSERDADAWALSKLRKWRRKIFENKRCNSRSGVEKSIP